MKPHLVLSLTLAMMTFSCQSTGTQNFTDKQRRYPRVQTAIQEKDSLLRQLFADRGLAYPPQKIFIRIFKQEKILELWAFSASEDVFKLVKHYAVCRTSGNLGPKRREGDFQIPEGFYFIDKFNPRSNFYLSLGINYPNRSDQILGDKDEPGGDIFIHGGCVTVGCIPITDEYIKEVYWVAVQAKSNGHAKIPVHIFPTKLDTQAIAQLKSAFPNDDLRINFWRNLQIGYNWFERFRRLPTISVNQQGMYQFEE